MHHRFSTTLALLAIAAACGLPGLAQAAPERVIAVKHPAVIKPYRSLGAHPSAPVPGEPPERLWTP
ncbi:MAG: hypothetical protein OWU84_13920 [Firmicutes bacterium]|nr:hypothetical protein [Bacillota bacterium]